MSKFDTWLEREHEKSFFDTLYDTYPITDEWIDKVGLPRTVEITNTDINEGSELIIEPGNVRIAGTLDYDCRTVPFVVPLTHITERGHALDLLRLLTGKRFAINQPVTPAKEPA